MFEALSRLPFAATEIAGLTQQDNILSRVYNAVQDCTVDKLAGDEFKPYYRGQWNLQPTWSASVGESHVIVPSAARPHILELLHAGHKGIVTMKKSARRKRMVARY